MNAERKLIRLATFAMGTRFEFVLVGEDEVHLRAAGEQAIAEIEDLHARLSCFSRASVVSHLNQHGFPGPVALDRETFDLLALARDIWRDSDGAFDITVAPLMRALGFREGGAPQNSAVNPIGMNLIELDDAACTARFTQAGVAIDLGAIAKGYALDCAAAILREADIDCALLHGGTSTVVAIGSPPDEGTNGGWRVRIHDELEPHDVMLRDAALSVSAPRGRVVERDGATIGHVLDPRTRRPAAGAMCAAAIAESAAVADAWSTALLVTAGRPADMPGSIRSIVRCGATWYDSEAAENRIATRMEAVA